MFYLDYGWAWNLQVHQSCLKMGHFNVYCGGVWKSHDVNSVVEKQWFMGLSSVSSHQLQQNRYIKKKIHDTIKLWGLLHYRQTFANHLMWTLIGRTGVCGSTLALSHISPPLPHWLTWRPEVCIWSALIYVHGNAAQKTTIWSNIYAFYA